MRRTIIKQGGGAYTITLPIEWVRAYGLDKKAEVDVEASENVLLVTPLKKVQGASVRLAAEGFSERTIYLHLAALYARGADEIIVESSSERSTELTRILANLLGFALVDQKGNECTIRDLGAAIKELDEIFKRVFQMVLLFYDAAASDIFGVQRETLDSLKARDIEVNKFCLYLERAINKRSYRSAINGRALFTYSFMLEKIGDEVERLWRTNIKYKITKSKALRELMAGSRETLALAFDFYYQRNPRLIERMLRSREHVREASMRLPKPDVITTRFVRHVVKIAEDAADLTHLSLIRSDNEA